MSRSAILSMIVLMVPGYALADRVIPSERVVNGVNVRAGQTSDSEKRALLRPGESLEFVEEIPGWYRVKLDNSTETGFVAKSFTDRVSDEFVIVTPLPPREEDELRVHFLAIGTGTCTVVECPGPNAPPMVVDCGSTDRSETDLTLDVLRVRVQEILDGRTTNLVLSHGDADHFNRIESVLQGIPLGDVWQGGESDEYTDELQTFLEQNVSDLDDLHRDLDKDFHNDEFALDDDQLDCGDASVFILTVNTGVKTNAQSLVMLIEHHDFAVTFTGDAFGKTERKAWENHGSRVKTTVLSGSHHGASSKGSNGTGPTSSQWPEKTAPEVLVYSAGNKYRHPRCAATKQYHPYIAEGPVTPPPDAYLPFDHAEVRPEATIPVTALSGATGADVVLTMEEITRDFDEDPEPFVVPILSGSGSFDAGASGADVCFNFGRPMEFTVEITELEGAPTRIPVHFNCQPANQEDLNADPIVVTPEADAGQVCFTIP